jgi:hypothetical protein
LRCIFFPVMAGLDPAIPEWTEQLGSPGKAGDHELGD